MPTTAEWERPELSLLEGAPVPEDDAEALVAVMLLVLALVLVLVGVGVDVVVLLMTDVVDEMMGVTVEEGELMITSSDVKLDMPKV